MNILALCDSLCNKTFACSEKNELIKIDGQRLSVYIIIVFLIYFINAFHLFWSFLFWVKSRAFNNDFPDL